ncbi:hypothetical protein [uncultured Imperialibacter sp.]|uniref:hypothetical protein n=1 Tax=uncultured Imperialibacter sp. TaxID=1672639 RepID=UPI0030D8D571|tara:strand:+ start:4884 stop:5195 length:312 start_codon:yes stop_codon:yes gene_type:complete
MMPFMSPIVAEDPHAANTLLFSKLCKKKTNRQPSATVVSEFSASGSYAVTIACMSANEISFFDAGQKVAPQIESTILSLVMVNYTPPALFEEPFPPQVKPPLS